VRWLVEKVWTVQPIRYGKLTKERKFRQFLWMPEMRDYPLLRMSLYEASVYKSYSTAWRRMNRAQWLLGACLKVRKLTPAEMRIYLGKVIERGE
jgi:hypothetical protein